MHQYLFFIAGFPIRMYGLFFALGILSGGITAYFLAKKDGRWHHHILDITLYSGLMGIVGGRLWDVFFFDWDYYQNHLLEIPFVWQGGMAIQGGLVFGIITAIIYLRKNRIDILSFADLVAPAIILGQSIGRMANLMNGDAFGSPTGGNFGIIYPENTFAHHMYGSQPLWPTEIWEGQIDVLIFVILLAFTLFPHRKGQVFGLYIILYSIARFFLEFLRGDYGLAMGSLKSAQITSILGVVIGVILFLYSFIKHPRSK